MPVPEERVRAAFVAFDRDGDGEITSVDALSAIRACGVVMDEAEAQKLPGQLSYAQFAEWMAKRTASYDAQGELIKLFKTFDRNSNGTLDAEELRQVMKTLATLLNEQDINQIIHEADPGETGKVNYENFVHNLLTG